MMSDVSFDVCNSFMSLLFHILHQFPYFTSNNMEHHLFASIPINRYNDTAALKGTLRLTPVVKASSDVMAVLNITPVVKASSDFTAVLNITPVVKATYNVMAVLYITPVVKASSDVLVDLCITAVVKASSDVMA